MKLGCRREDHHNKWAVLLTKSRGLVSQGIVKTSRRFVHSSRPDTSPQPGPGICIQSSTVLLSNSRPRLLIFSPCELFSNGFPSSLPRDQAAGGDTGRCSHRTFKYTARALHSADLGWGPARAGSMRHHISSEGAFMPSYSAFGSWALDGGGYYLSCFQSGSSVCFFVTVYN